jgi:hypothetical protein
MPIVELEHNLQDFELEETLEKALGSIRQKIQRPARKFSQPALEELARAVTGQFDGQMKKMTKRIEAVIQG